MSETSLHLVSSPEHRFPHICRAAEDLEITIECVSEEQSDGVAWFTMEDENGYPVFSDCPAFSPQQLQIMESMLASYEHHVNDFSTSAFLQGPAVAALDSAPDHVRTLGTILLAANHVQAMSALEIAKLVAGVEPGGRIVPEDVTPEPLSHGRSRPAIPSSDLKEDTITAETRISKSIFEALERIAAEQQLKLGELLDRVLQEYARDYERDVREIPMQRGSYDDDRREDEEAMIRFLDGKTD